MKFYVISGAEKINETQETNLATYRVLWQTCIMMKDVKVWKKNKNIQECEDKRWHKQPIFERS